MAAENIPTFKLVLGKHIVPCYLVSSVSDHLSLNFLIDNIYLVLDGPTLQLLAFSPRALSETLLHCVQLAMVEPARPLSSR